MNERNAYLGEKPIGKLLFQLALPAVTAQLINLLYSLVDRMYIGRIPDVGAYALTGIGITLPVILIITAFSSLIGMGGAPRVSVFLGKQEYERAEQTVGNCVSMILIIAVILTIIFSVWTKEILTLFGGSEETLPYAMEYMKIYVLGTIFVQLSLGLNPFITAQGFAKTSMITVVVGAIINIILDPIFIFGFGMGVKGAALATILAQCVSSIWVIVFLTGKKTMLRIRRENLRPTLAIILPVLGLGVSPFIMQITESLLQMTFNTSLLKYGGNTAVGAMTILTSVMQLAMMPLNGISQGMQPIMGYNYGAGNIARVKGIFRLTAIVSVTYTSTYWLVNMIFPQAFASIFTTDTELIAYTAWAIRIYMAVYLIYGLQTVCQQSFIALGNAITSLFLAIWRKIILLIPLIYILPNFFEDKVFAVFLAEPVSDFLAVCTTVTVFAIQFKKTLRKMEDGNK
ncbi:MAG: MATE family efflux transporter [Eubacteriales bacterium]